MNDQITDQPENQTNLPTGENCLLCSYNERGHKVKLCDDCKREAFEQYELCGHLVPALEYDPAKPRCENCQMQIDEVFDDFWRDIVCDGEGNLDPERVKAELFDFHFVIGSVSAVYDSLTSGRLSKPNYTPDVVINQVNELQERELTEAAEEAVGDEKAEILAYIRFFQSQFDTSSLSYLQCETLHDHIERGIYKQDDRIKPFLQLPETAAVGGDASRVYLQFCQNCQMTCSITDDFRCANCSEPICTSCGCTDTEACADGCDWVRPGLCSNCEGENANEE